MLGTSPSLAFNVVFIQYVIFPVALKGESFVIERPEAHGGNEAFVKVPYRTVDTFCSTVSQQIIYKQ